MPVERRHFDQLNTPQSWKSPVSVIAHIDLDAFYAQCLGVHNNIDPSEPLGCRQWQSLIAINYPARKYGLKRGVSVDEARRLCPGIHLPHVATFKKGESNWEFHERPDPNNYKVSLDHFRRESRKIFSVFKHHFRVVEKAGIDEGFMDIGPDVYREVLNRMPTILETAKEPSETIELSHDDLIDIGAELVNDVRLEIHRKLRYTCSAGIAANKQLAKLGSGYKKPFNQTSVHSGQVNEFLANFKITDVWGWGGKLGKEVIAKLEIGEGVEDQCEYVRENFSLADLQRKLKDNAAQSLYKMVRGNYSSEVSSRTMIKSMAAVKDFRKLKHLNTREDVESWLRVFSADLSGRLADLMEDMGCSVVPKTISVTHYKRGSQRKQQNFESTGAEVDQLREQIYKQSSSLARTFVKLPCEYLVVEISHIQELPRERLKFEPIKKQEPEVINPTSSTEDEEELFVNEESCSHEKCKRCGKNIAIRDLQEHQDWHYAMDLQSQDRTQSLSSSSQYRNSESPSPTKRTQIANGNNRNQHKKLKRPPKDQKSILDFFK